LEAYAADLISADGRTAWLIYDLALSQISASEDNPRPILYSWRDATEFGKFFSKRDF
jgi:hypothetical protein